MKIELTKEQVSAIIQFADIAVRQAGLQAAGPALEIAMVMQKALEANKEEGAE
jgi:hypothetical protein